MYIFTKNTKIICLSLIMIGLVAIGYGFYSASKMHYSDDEIKEKVKSISYNLGSTKNSQDINKPKYDSHHGSVNHEFSDLFSALIFGWIFG